MHYTDYSDETIHKLQELELMILKDFIAICEENNIEYFIYGGSALGAVRHGGFIPWDDDIDLSIMRKDYEKLIKVLPEEISKYEYFKENCGLSLLIFIFTNCLAKTLC